MEFWGNLYKSKETLKLFSIAYHKAIKKILSVSYKEHNHPICKITNNLTFDHLINKIILKFVFKLYKKPCKFVYKCYSFLKDHSNILNETNEILKSKYNVLTSILENDINAVIARIYYVFNYF